MKITKKAFIEAMTANYTAFIGVTRRLFTEDEVYCKIQDLLKPDAILEKRSCVARSRDLVFSGGSHLWFNQIGEYKFYKYAYPNAFVYVCYHSVYDDFDETYHTKAMYYLVTA